MNPKLNTKQLCCIAFFVLYFASGYAYDPFAGLVIASLYELGLIGLVMMYKSTKTNGRHWLFLVGGFVLVLVAESWLDRLLAIVGHY